MSEKDQPEFDTSPVDAWIGVPLGGGQMKDPVGANDIRRWTQGMQNANPLYYDEGYAAEGRFGRLVAPESFAVCTDDSHGAGPAIQGYIEGTHMLFGGDEWWFFGPRIEPGDRISRSRMLFDYKVTETKFAGPTMFSRGDTTYVNHRGEFVAKQRSTSIRYRADLARERAQFSDTEIPQWSLEQVEEIEKQKFEYIRSIRDLGHQPRVGVKEGDRLPTRPIGPHTIPSFTTEWRAYLMTVWNAFADDGGPSSLMDAGWLPEMSRDLEGAKVDPALGDGLYHGPSRGHVQQQYAQLIGLPRAYGYGATMGAWSLDFVSNWIGEWGDILHSNMSYRSPAFEGDMTRLDGEVISADASSGVNMVRVAVTMTNQREEVMATGETLVRLSSGPDSE